MTVQYVCRNMTMETFAEWVATIVPHPILDETGLKGNWNFELSMSLGLSIPSGQGSRITIFDAVDKLGLKLKPRQVPTPVIVVDNVNEQPSANPPGTAEALPALPALTEFEVASVKPAASIQPRRSYRMQPGGRFIAQGMGMRFLVMQAFALNNDEQFAGLPAWADSARFDITAKAPGNSAQETAGPMIRALLVDRFKMTYHTEDRQVAGYALVAVKPRLKKADPASRTFCKPAAAPAGSPLDSRLLNCQNVTLAQFADRLQNRAPELTLPVLDATGIDGTWDISLLYSQHIVLANQAGRGGESPSDPAGGYTVFEAVEKQLGLKLEKQKRSIPVIVIDRLEPRPTEN
jgi:uncharacterized protein (TIGR03435 family)